jgi:cobalamin biosynthesis protein CbiD
MTTVLNVPAIAAREMIPAGCCPVPAAAAAVQLLMFRDGVVDVEVDEPAGTLTVSHDERIEGAELAEELTAVGMAATLA